MVFIFDIDDTISETDEFSESFINQSIIDYKLPYKQISKIGRYADYKFDWSQEEAIKWYKVFGDEMLLLFPCKPNAVKTINALYDMGHKIIITTARDTLYHTNPLLTTKLWLSKNKIKYNKLIISRSDKENVCEEENADFIIDDSLSITKRVAEKFEQSAQKCQALLMSSAYNLTQQEAPNVVRINDYPHLVEYLKSNGIDISAQLNLNEK